jgi:uncharacterized protein
LALRIWIDALTPKQALFASAMVESASPKKCDITVTTRNYSELNKLLDKLGLKFTSIGSHGGGDLLAKLKASVERQIELISFANDSQFDCSFSFISPEAARVSFGLGIPHYICSDSPHASAPSRLAVPLSKLLFCPFPIERERWTQYGLRNDQVQKYHALDPWAWLSKSSVKTSRKVNGKVLIRLEEWFASYFKKGHGVSSAIDKLLAAIRRAGDFEVTLVPRYDEQREWARREYGDRTTVPPDAIDGVKEISEADLLIGGGATMTQEAALLGVPNISYFPSADLDVFRRYYFPKTLSIEASNPSALIRQSFSLLKDIDRQKELFWQRARKETRSYEDPVKFIFSRLEAD